MDGSRGSGRGGGRRAVVAARSRTACPPPVRDPAADVTRGKLARLVAATRLRDAPEADALAAWLEAGAAAGKPLPVPEGRPCPGMVVDDVYRPPTPEQERSWQAHHRHRYAEAWAARCVADHAAAPSPRSHRRLAAAADALAASDAEVWVDSPLRRVRLETERITRALSGAADIWRRHHEVTARALVSMGLRDALDRLTKRVLDSPDGAADDLARALLEVVDVLNTSGGRLSTADLAGARRALGGNPVDTARLRDRARRVRPGHAPRPADLFLGAVVAVLDALGDHPSAVRTAVVSLLSDLLLAAEGAALVDPAGWPATGPPGPPGRRPQLRHTVAAPVTGPPRRGPVAAAA